MANLREGKFGSYYGSYYSQSEALSTSEMQTNARYIYSALLANGWTANAISALLGNMQAESSLNSGRWQSDNVGNTSGGYGLVQWTPSTNYTSWATSNGYSDPSEMDANIARILYELENGLQWYATSAHNYSFKTFATATDKSVSELAKAFLLNYERPADQSASVQSYRAGLAEDWYTYLLGVEPSDPSEPSNPSEATQSKKKKGFNFILFNQRRRKQWTARKF